MFQESLVESAALLQPRNRWPALLSFAAQAVVAVAIIALPLLHPELLPLRAPALALVPPPPPRPPQPPPPLQRVHATLTATHAPEMLTVPPAHTAMFRNITHLTPPSDDPPVAMSVGPMVSSPAPAGIGFGDGPGTRTSVSVVPAATPAHTGPLHISAGVTAGLLLAPIQSTYPALAKAARVEGTVVIHAIISRSGRIEQAQVLSGSPMLQTAALEAVRQARYRPYLLSGQPTEVDTTITVNFRLAG